MADQIVRCPYCVLGNDLRQMLRRLEGWFICQKCGHTVMTDNLDFKCFCQKCGELNRAA
jgi:DNA-directed RNA polymerase subunit RPC12/RpoP